MVYLFAGEDEVSKKRKLDSLKREFLSKDTKEFNYDVLYAKEIDPLKFKELLKSSTFGGNIRLVIIKDALNLSDSVKEYILSYLRSRDPKTILIIDIKDFDPKDEFIQKVFRYAKTFRFRRPIKVNTFDLSRALEKKDLILSLDILSKLLSRGEKPERILGSLRYQWINDDTLEFAERKRRISLLLDTDINLKRGRLKPNFALELLITKLTALNQEDLSGKPRD